MVNTLYRSYFAILFSILLSAIRSLNALPVDNTLNNIVYPNSNWNSLVKNDYSKALNQHISPWKSQTGSTRSTLVFDQQITSATSNTFIFKENFNGVPTPNTRIVRYNADNTVEIIESTTKIPDTQPTLASKTSGTAISQCINYLGLGNPKSSQSSLMVLPFRGSFYLVYVVIARFNVLTEHTCFVNAVSEYPSIVFSFTNSKNAVGQSLYNGAVNFTTTQISSVYFLEDPTGKQAVFDCQGTDCSVNIRLNSTTNTWSNNVSVSVAWGIQQVYQYFLNAHGRNGMDGSGGPGVVVSAGGNGTVIPHYIDFGTNETGATFTPNGIYYGTGDGVNYGPAVALDIIAHEWAHGVLYYAIPGGMNNFDESGALEESFCDVIGAMVDNYVFGESNNTWKIGEGYYAPGSGKALRYMNDPTLADNKNLTINDDPDHYTKKYNGTLDNGGIHVNSGIVNKVFYLLAKGGTHPYGGPTMTGVGITAAAQIWYKAYTSYMTASTDFAGARDATVSACSVLFGASSNTCFEVQVAWGLCGVGSVPTPTPYQLIINPGIERTQSPWTISGTGVSWFSNSLYACAGSGYLMLGTVNNAGGSANQGLITMSNNTGNATLSFQLKIETVETGITIKDSMTVEVRNSVGQLLSVLALYSNVNATVGYISCGPFPLFSFKSSPFRISFAVISDSISPTYFYVDQVLINTYLY